MGKRYNPDAIPNIEWLDGNDGHFVFVSLHHDGRLTVSEVDPEVDPTEATD
jgi:hypothetical protein